MYGSIHAYFLHVHSSGQFGSYAHLEFGQRDRGAACEGFSGAFEGRYVDAVADEFEAFAGVVLLKVDGEPCDVTT